MGKIAELEESLRLANKAAMELNFITQDQRKIIDAMANELVALRTHPPKGGLVWSPEEIVSEYKKKFRKGKKRAVARRKKR